jgi:hypothetical protein
VEYIPGRHEMGTSFISQRWIGFIKVIEPPQDLRETRPIYQIQWYSTKKQDNGWYTGEQLKLLCRANNEKR